MKPNELDALIEDCLEGRLGETDAAKLSALLEQSAEARARYWEAASIHGLLEHTMQGASLRVVTGQAFPARPRVNRWLAWGPLAAAAAGLVIGLFCASVVFAYVAPSLGKVVTLLDDGFESGSAPLVKGVPVESGQWSGDYSEVVGQQQGVKSENGRKMLRFLRGDYEGKANAQESRVADLYRLIDMRPYRQEFADGSAVLQLSAGFNASEFPIEETYSSRMTILAFDADTLAKGTLHTVNAWEENCLAAASTGAARLDRTPETWQRRASELRLPAYTDFLLIHLMISAGRGNQPGAGFGGHYIDDVRLTMHHSPLR